MRALRSYRRAARDGPKLPQPLVAIARVELELGRRIDTGQADTHRAAGGCGIAARGAPASAAADL